jgi:uncharacterized delta-60 repeat protein
MKTQRRVLCSAGIALAALAIFFLGPPLLARTGTPDPTFNPGTGPNGPVFSVAAQPDGKILLGGTFTSVNGTAIRSIARLNADGSLDPSFNPGTGPNGTVYRVALQPDGKIIIGGAFQTVNGTTLNGVARLNADGSVDPGFNSGSGVFGTVYSLALQPDGYVLIGGGFMEFNFLFDMARLQPSGILDGGFNPGTDFNNAVEAIVLQPDGKIVVGGDFTTAPGQLRNRIARLNANGSGDDSFDPGAGTSSSVTTLALQGDGKVLLGGPILDAVNHVMVDRVARLNSDGSVDSTFAPGSIQNYQVYALMAQTDGKILLGGDFLGVNGVAYSLAMRLKTNGSVDASFNPGASPNTDGVFTLAQQADGKIIVGGAFTSINGVVRHNIARLLNDPATQILLIPDPTQVVWLRGGAGPEVSRVTFELSTNGGTHWSLLGSGTRTSGGWRLAGLSLPEQGLIRARGRTSNDNSGLIEQVQAISPYQSVAADKGGQVPGQPAGTTYGALGVPCTGAFVGTKVVGTAKVPAIFASDGSVLLAVSGTVPGLNGALATKLRGPSGDAAVVTLKTGTGGITSLNSTALVTGLSTKALQVAAQTGTPAPGLPAEVSIKSFLAFDGNGTDTFFTATLQGTSVSSQNSLALCATLGSGTVHILARKGDLVNGKQIATIGTFLSSPGTAADGRWRGDPTDFGVRLSFTDKSQAICLIPSTASGPADWSMLAATGTIATIPVLNGMVATGFGLPGFGNASAAELVKLAAGQGGATSANNIALVTGTVGGSVVLAQKGGSAPDAAGAPMPGVVFKTLCDPVAGQTPAVAFQATLSGTGITSKNNLGLWFSADGSTPKLLARTGAPAPGGGHWAGFKSMVLPHRAGAGPVFLGTLQASAADGVTASNNLGLWGVASNGTMQLLLRSGQPAFVDDAPTTVKTFTALVPVTSSLGTASGYDDSGNVAALVTFANGAQALIQVGLP